MRRIARLPLKDRTLPQLARIALRGLGNDRSWQAVSRLHMRGRPQTLALASRLARAMRERRRGGCGVNFE